MAPQSSIPYNPADLGAPNALLPEEVFGHIDLATLADIHRFLRESELQDDIELATWVQENYLNGHSEDHSTAIIRTAQGFGQLDRAFRRVRSLTNKAQDKWPFFDRNFKQMSSATVRNNARGEAAPGVMYSIDGTQGIQRMAGQLHTSTISNGLDTTNASPVPQLQVPFVPLKPGRYQAYKSQFPSPARRTHATPSSDVQPIPPQGAELSQESQQQEVKTPTELPNHADLSSKRNEQAMDQPETAQHDAHQVAETPHAESEARRESPSSEPINASLSYDADILPSKEQEVNSVPESCPVKVRGPDGRYLRSNDLAPVIKKAKKPKKGGRTSAGKAMKKEESLAQKVISEEPGIDATEESISTNNQSTSLMTPAQKSEENDGIIVVRGIDTVMPPAINDEKQHVKVGEAFNAGISAAYLLAAEADAIPSNLDRLPPNSRKAAKRKIEPTAPSSERKRGRYGGIVGRPRRTDQAKLSQKALDAAVPQMETRRRARHSAAANLGGTGPTVPSSETHTEVPAPKDDVVMDDVQERMHVNAGHEPKSGPSEVSAPLPTPPPSSSMNLQPTHTTEVDMMSMGLNVSGLPTPQQSVASLSMGLTNTHSPAPEQPIVSSAPPAPTMTNDEGATYPPGHVELIARITTGSGTIELPISEDQINSVEVNMIRKYAEWNAAKSAVPVSYAQFREIFSFGKES